MARTIRVLGSLTGIAELGVVTVPEPMAELFSRQPREVNRYAAKDA